MSLLSFRLNVPVVWGYHSRLGKNCVINELRGNTKIIFIEAAQSLSFELVA